MLALIVLLLWCAGTGQAAITSQVAGPSGPLCGAHRCLAGGEAACIGGKCECQSPNSQGIGHFLCTRPDEHFCAILNDPMVRGFDSSHTKIPLLFKFIASHMVTKTCTGTDPDNAVITNGVCDIKLYPWGTRKNGKTYLRGIQVNILVAADFGIYHHATRIWTTANNGVYSFTEDGNKNAFGGGAYGDPVTTTTPLGLIHTVQDAPNKFARLVVEPCGVEIGIRGAEMVGDPLILPPGVYIKVLDACAPLYALSESRTICSPPLGFGTTLEQFTQQISDQLGRPVSMNIAGLYKALTGQVMQDFPGAPPSLQVLADTAEMCDLLPAIIALEYCMFIIENPRFLRCIDKDTSNGEKALALLAQCMFSFCDGNPFTCTGIKNSILNDQCDDKIRPGELTIFDHDCIF